MKRGSLNGVVGRDPDVRTYVNIAAVPVANAVARSDDVVVHLCCKALRMSHLDAFHAVVARSSW